MTAGLAVVAPIAPSDLTPDQIRAFQASLPHRYVDERRACEIALQQATEHDAWPVTARRWVAYRINRLAGLDGAP